jgi:sigma-B regulation protein RsbU (phosphoserine phosphatase)
VRRVTLGVEWALFAGGLLIALTGDRLAFVDRFGRRGDVVALSLLLVIFAWARRMIERRLLPSLERRFAPAPYDGQRMLFDLGQEARTAASVDQLYESIAARIGESFETAYVSIFVREEERGDYLCRVTSPSSESTPSHPAPSAPPTEDALDAPPPLKFARDAFVVKRLLGLTSPLVIDAAELETWDQALSFAPPALRESRRREQEVLRRIKGSLLVQIRAKERMNGILSLSLRRGQFPYSAADKEVLMSIASQLALVIENARLAERMVVEERLRRELALAAEVQRRLLPERPPEGLAVELAGFCQPARGVGGDYYDFIKFDNQQLGIAIADVAGKGIAAALLMSTVQATLRSLSAGADANGHANGSLAEMVTRLNRLLCNSTRGANYVTFFYAQFDPRTRRLAYVNAGHNPPLFFRASPSHDFKALSSGGMFVGMFEHCGYEQDVVQMQSGDVLIAFTDGLSEALDTRGEEFDESRIRDALADSVGRPVHEIRDEMVRRVQAWCAGAPQHDDLTFLVMKVK